MSDTGRSAATSPSAQIGAELRARRESLGWKLPDLARSLRIRESYLEAIEAGRIGELPGTTYALGFVRAYASALGLPGEQVAARFRDESAEAAARPTLSFPVPVPRRGVPAGALMLVGLLILAGAYSGWYYVTEHQRTPAETVPPIPDHLLPHAAEKPAPSPQVASILPSASAPSSPALAPAPPQPSAQPPAGAPSAAVPNPAATPQATAPQPAAPTQPATPAPAAAPPGVNGRPAASAGPAPVLPGIAPALSPAPTAQTPPAAPARPAVPAAGQPAQADAAAGHTIAIHATAPAWVTIRPKAGGRPVLNRLMNAGDSWSVPSTQTGLLLLTTGNAGATQLTVDNTPVVSMGPPGTVFRDLPLDPEMLKSGHLPPSRPPHPKPKVQAEPADAAPSPAAGTQ